MGKGEAITRKRVEEKEKRRKREIRGRKKGREVRKERRGVKKTTGEEERG